MVRPALSNLRGHRQSEVYLHLLSDVREQVPAQAAMLSACQASKSCKKFIPSEMGGDIHPSAFPRHPLFYVPTHIPIREALAKQTDVEYTFLCIGWFGDYWNLPAGDDAKWKSYMKDLRPVWPVDTTKRTVRINGDGKARVTFTTARDVAAAMVKLFAARSWVSQFHAVVSRHLS